jgi:hypothetical protein
MQRGVSGEPSMTEGDDRLVDRDPFAGSPGESPWALPNPGGLFATLQRVIDATLAVFQVDGASLAMEHEDGSLRWVVVTDGAAGLLEDTQRELGEGPGLAAYGDGAAVMVLDLATDRRFARLAAVVTPRGLRGVLAVPVVVAGRPVGALSVYATEPCPWSGIDVAAVGAYAGVVAELVAASMALDARDAELTQALTAQVWVEQARGALVATEGLDPASASERLRARAGASQRTVADVAREVVQDAQRDRTAVIAAERARSRAAEARAAQAEAALEAVQAAASEKDAGADGPPAAPGAHHDGS